MKGLVLTARLNSLLGRNCHKLLVWLCINLFSTSMLRCKNEGNNVPLLRCFVISYILLWLFSTVVLHVHLAQHSFMWAEFWSEAELLLNLIIFSYCWGVCGKIMGNGCLDFNSAQLTPGAHSPVDFLLLKINFLIIITWRIYQSF